MNAMVFHAPMRPHLRSPDHNDHNSYHSDHSDHGSSNSSGSPSLEYRAYQQFAGPRFNAPAFPHEVAAPASATFTPPATPSSLSAPSPVPSAASSSTVLSAEAVTALTVTYLRGPLRRGKWTLAEEEYTAAMIHYFCGGVIGIPFGTTLRSHLASQLHCDPMRISKKLLPGTIVAGFKMMPKIGRRGYFPRVAGDANDAAALEEHQRSATDHLESLRVAFLSSLEAMREEEEEYERLEAHYRAHYGRRAAAAAAATATSAELSPNSRKRTRSIESEAQHWDPRASYDAHVQREPSIHPSHHHHQVPSATSLMEMTATNTTAMALPPLRLSLQRASVIMAKDRK